MLEGQSLIIASFIFRRLYVPGVFSPDAPAGCPPGPKPPSPGPSRTPAREPPSSLQTAGGARPPPASPEGLSRSTVKSPLRKVPLLLDAVATLGPRRNAASGPVPSDRAGARERPAPRPRLCGKSQGAPGPAQVPRASEPTMRGLLRRGEGDDRALGSAAPPVVLGGKGRRGRGQRRVLASVFRPPSPPGPSPVQGAGWADDRWPGAK